MYLITGANGQLGRCLKVLFPREQVVLTDLVASIEDGYEVMSLDITDAQDVKKFIEQHFVHCIINCAAYTAVDKAEDEVNKAELINVIGAENLARSGVETIIHISTDYVFDGHAYKPLTPEDMVNPQSVYGRTKFEGERRILQFAKHNAVIIRTAWLYSNYGNNFVKTMRRLGMERSSINVVSDQIGSPTLADDLAKAILCVVNYLELPKKTDARLDIALREIYHFTDEGVCSWYDLAVAVMQGLNLNCQVKPISGCEYPSKAERPFYSVLDKTKFKRKFGVEIPHWQESLKKCLSRF